MDNKNLLIVGGAGYIGSHACKYLAKKGFSPIVYDNLVYGHREAVKWGPFEDGSLGDSERLKQVLRKYHPRAVMHFAAFAYVGESIEKPSLYYRNNVVDTLNLLDIMVELNVENFIFSSSCAIYGIPQKIPIEESAAQTPINPYGRTKFMVEKILEDYDKAYGLKFACLRYFNAAGADPEGEIGEDHAPETHLIPLVLDVAAGKRPKISVFGHDYPTEDGTCIRDYIHVMDLAQAHWQALEYLIKTGKSLSLNLGNGVGYSVKEVIRTAERITGCDIPISLTERRPGDPPKLVGSAQKASEILGWKPVYNSLDTIVETAWNWHKNKR